MGRQEAFPTSSQVTRVPLAGGCHQVRARGAPSSVFPKGSVLRESQRAPCVGAQSCRRFPSGARRAGADRGPGALVCGRSSGLRGLFQVPVACFVGRSRCLSRKEAPLIWERKPGTGLEIARAARRGPGVPSSWGLEVPHAGAPPPVRVTRAVFPSERVLGSRALPEVGLSPCPPPPGCLPSCGAH